MKNECDRCQEYTPDSPGAIFTIYHALLCRNCRNEMELWLRTQEFWERQMELDATLQFLSLPKTSVMPNLDRLLKLGTEDNVNKLAAFPRIEAWVKAGKAKEGDKE